MELMPWSGAVAALALLVGVTTLWLFGAFRALVGLDRLVARSWQQVDDELRRREELVPDLLAAVRARARVEERTVGAVAAARAAVRAAARPPVATVPDRAAAERELSVALDDLFTAAERLAGLRSDESYRALHRELTDIEARATAARRLYNTNVVRLNARLASFPASVVARPAGVGPRERAGSVSAGRRTAADAGRRPPADSAG